VNVAASPDEKETGQKVISEEVKFAPAKTPVEEPPAAPSIRISGIVWSEEPSRRLAVINGIALTEGALIEEVQVLEIYPTRVRFSHQGRPFEIHLGSTAVIK
jgi:type II secretory pathway component PulC